MKNLSIALNAVLLIAVCVLFYLVLSKNSAGSADPKTTPKNPEVVKNASNQKMPDGKFAFVNLDSISLKFEYIEDKTKELQGRYNVLKNKYETQAMSLQTDYEQLQQSAQAGIISQADLEKKGQELEMRRNQVLKLQNDMAAMEDEQLKIQAGTIEKVNDFIKRYNEQYHYEFIFTKGSMINTIAYADESKDITAAVIAGLNEEYKAQKASGKK